MVVPGRVMVVVEQLLLGYAVYVFAFRFLPGVDFGHYELLQILLGAIFIGLFIMVEVCFIRASMANPGYTYDKFTQEYEDKGEKHLESITTERKNNGEMRRCNKCKKAKPDRAHHCSICNRCILKMDHHCPFINNCVGFYNYKYFFIFISWALCFCFFVIACMAYDGYHIYEQGHPKYDYFEIAAGILCAIVAFLLLILFANHVKFIVNNLTTIEHVEKKVMVKKHPYNLGFRRNFVEVFGSNPFLWPFPVWTSLGDGITYSVQAETSSLLIHT